MGGVDKWQRGKKGGLESKVKLNTGPDLAVLVLRCWADNSCSLSRTDKQLQCDGVQESGWL